MIIRLPRPLTTRELNLARGIRVSMEDIDLLDILLSIHVDSRHGYKAVTVPIGKRVRRKQDSGLGHIILKRMGIVFGPGDTCDHMDRNPLNNERSNLRKCTHKQNCCNRVFNEDQGVNLHRGKYRAYIHINGHQLCATCDSKEDALALRKQWERRFYGEFAPVTSQQSSS